MLHTIQIVMRLIYNFLTLKEDGNNYQLGLYGRYHMTLLKNYRSVYQSVD